MLAEVEGQLTWMVYIVGAIVKGRLSSSSAESQVRWCVQVQEHICHVMGRLSEQQHLGGAGYGGAC